MRRVRVTYPLLVGILLGSSLPVLLIVQFFLDRARGGPPRLESRLEIRAEGQDPLILTADLLPAQQGAAVAMDGTGRLLQGGFPWEPTAIEARFALRLDPETLAAPGEYTEGWAASYRERLMTRLDGLGIPPVPCQGRIVVKSVYPEGLSAPALKDLDTLKLALDLRCTSAGPDLRWGTGDERTWTVEGPVSLERSRGAAAG